MVFADWLIAPDNPWFARSVANRVWAWLFGRGIVHEPDDIRPDNPPSNPELLAYLERELVHVRLRPEAPLPADPQLAHLPAVVDPAQRPPATPRRSSPTTRCGGSTPRC